MSIIKDLELKVNTKIKEAGYEIDNFRLQVTNRPDLGHYQVNDAMPLAKTYHENPRVIAQNIVEKLEELEEFTNINIAGPGFINLSLTDEFIIKALNEINNDIESNIDKEESKKIVIDYGGANVAKALHVGHLRSANIGEALKRLAKLLGHEVIGDAHLGDYGRPLGLVIKEIKERYPNLPYFDNNYTGTYEEIDLPITNKDLEEIYPFASTKGKEDESYLEDARNITTKIQNHEKGYYDLWKKIVEISKEDIKKVYDELNVSFELWNGEADAVEYLDELLKIYETKKLVKESEGARIVEVEKESDKAPMPPLLLIRSNGSISYETTDLATILQRKKEINPTEIWYVVDARQSLHLEQVFRASRKANLIDENVELNHIAFGTMNGSDGKPFKTRDGGVMSLKNLIELVYDTTYQKIKNDSVTETEKKDIAHDVAIATLKYADLLPYVGTDYIFDIEKFSDLEGKTGPYLLYSTIRMNSLLTKAGDLKIDSYQVLSTDTERQLALELLNLPTVLTKSLENKTLNEICEYIYRLTSLYNSFYAENKVLLEKDSRKQESWLVLTKIVHDINMLLLNTLGINVPKKM